MNEGIKQGRMKAPKDKEIDGRKSTVDEWASYVTTPIISSTQRAHSGSLAEDPEEDTPDTRIKQSYADWNIIMDIHLSVLGNRDTCSW